MRRAVARSPSASSEGMPWFWLPQLLLLLSAAGPGWAKVAYVSQGGACTPEAPPGAACSTFAAALQNSSVTRIVLLEDITLSQSDWLHESHESPYAYLLGRDVNITSRNGSQALNFYFISDAVVLAPNVTLRFDKLLLENSRRGAGVGVDFFAGAEGSRIIMRDIIRWRYVCPAAPDAMKSHLSYPRAPGAPGRQKMSIRAEFCWRGECYGNDTLFYEDFAMVVVPGMTESAAYLPGYTLFLIDTVRVCNNILPDSCLKSFTRDQCLTQYTEAYIEDLNSPDDQRSTVIAAAVASVAGALAIAGAVAAALFVRRRRRRERLADEEAAKVLSRFGPLEDMVMSNKKHGWKVTHHAHANHNSDGGASAGGGAASLLSSRIELGVLLGAGSFGRVYRGRWQGKDVAVKVMQHDAHTASKIVNEVELMMMMQHANILPAAAGAGGGEGPQVYYAPTAAGRGTADTEDLGGSARDAEAQTWLIVEFCDGGTLADAVRTGRLGPRGDPDPAKVLVRLRDVASGMAYLHARNVLHGDLKAANVLLAASTAAPFGMVAKVADFGLSRMLKVGQTHRSTRTVGTVTHMPPELLRLGKLSPAGDVYAFGIIMWECWTGQAAFEKQHYGEVFERVVLRDERPPLPGNMPEPYALLMTRCWAADPMARPGFDAVLRLIQLMIDELLAPPPPSGGAGEAGGGAGGGGGGAPAGAAAGGPDGSWFFQDL
ncbi:MAG: kinase-like domain-containing protein [Monoraphidium minutum]|nr:MAG: kinase-like domain-containing protein [Monoraphidium minutum]